MCPLGILLPSSQHPFDALSSCFHYYFNMLLKSFRYFSIIICHPPSFLKSSPHRPPFPLSSHCP
jgi:hypothetical protein